VKAPNDLAHRHAPEPPAGGTATSENTTGVTAGAEGRVRCSDLLGALVEVHIAHPKKALLIISDSEKAVNFELPFEQLRLLNHRIGDAICAMTLMQRESSSRNVRSSQPEYKERTEKNDEI
jgi:hypothetical protein